MKFFATIINVTAALASTSASPVPDTEVGPAAANKFRLRTQLIKGREAFPADDRFDNLYLDTYHTGAGLNVAVVTDNKTEAIVGHFNGTRVQFNLGTAPYRYPYQLSLPGPEDFYAEWSQTFINVGQGGNKGFLIDEHGFLVNNNFDVSFNGWRVCRWVHEQPELFHDNYLSNASDPFIPANCATVRLVAEYD